MQSRDTLLAMLWPDLDQARGRHALRNVLHLIRRELGEEALISGGDGLVGVAPGSVACDALDVEVLLEQEKWAAALDAYEGEFLAGFHVGEAPEFEDWLHAERNRFRESMAAAAASLCEERAAAGNIAGAIRAAERRVQIAPDEEGGHRQLMQLLANHGEQAAALRAYDRLRDRLRDEYGAEPSRETRELAGSLQPARAGLPTAVPVREPAGSPAVEPPPLVESTRVQGTFRRRWPFRAGVAAAIGVAGIFVLMSGRAPASSTTETLLVVPVLNATGDSSATWLGEGLTLSVRDQFRRAGWHLVPEGRARRAVGEQPSVEAAARAVGAGLVLTGRADSTAGRVRLHLDVTPVGSDHPAATADALVQPQRLLDAELAVVSDVIGQLRPDLETDSLVLALRRGTNDDAAYRFYLQGAYLWDRRYSQADMERASARFDSALAHDPVYADALAARARIRFAMAWNGIGSVEAGMAAARGDARRAVELDSLSRVALSTLGAAETIHDSASARRLLERAVALDPDRSDTFFLLGLHYAFRGEHAIAERAFRRAVELEPLTPFQYVSLAASQVCQGKFGPAIETLEQLRAVSPRADLAPMRDELEASLLLSLGQWREAVPLLQSALRPMTPAVRSALARAQSASDVNAAITLHARQRLAARQPAGAQEPWQLRERARLSVRAGRQDDAVRLLLASRRTGDASLALACQDPAMQPVTQVPEVMAVMRLPQEP